MYKYIIIRIQAPRLYFYITLSMIGVTWKKRQSKNTMYMYIYELAQMFVDETMPKLSQMQKLVIWYS